MRENISAQAVEDCEGSVSYCIFLAVLCAFTKANLLWKIERQVNCYIITARWQTVVDARDIDKFGIEVFDILNSSWPWSHQLGASRTLYQLIKI